MKKIIINADDFGYSKENNEAVKLGYESGIITSASIMANMGGFEHAVKEILPAVENFDLGFHFNIIEGKSLSNVPILCDSNNNFNNNFIQIAVKSQNKNFLNQTEQEFRMQIEKVLKYHNISHIDSHVHIHSIPAIYNLIIKLAQEYKIRYIRTQKEIPYIVWNKSFNLKYPVNMIKNILLNSYTNINIKKLKKSQVKTNDYFIGVLYTEFMDEQSIIKGIKKIKKENSITEVIFHPYYSKEIPKNKEANYREFQITQNQKFKEIIENSGFIISGYSDI